MTKCIIFDVSGTLLYKPDVIPKIQKALNNHGYIIKLKDLIYHHMFLTETIKFPDRTDSSFYNYFNSELLYSLGIIPNNEVLKDIFKECTYLPWHKFEDTEYLKKINLPIGILSNFNTTLKSKLFDHFGDIFQSIIVSEEIGVAKPRLDFYTKGIELIGYKPEEILYIGDSLKLDIEPAKKLGIKTLLIDRKNFFKNSINLNKITHLSEIKNFI